MIFKFYLIIAIFPKLTIGNNLIKKRHTNVLKDDIYNK